MKVMVVRANEDMALSDARRGVNWRLCVIGPYDLSSARADHVQRLIFRTEENIAVENRRALNDAAVRGIFPLEFSIRRVQRVQVVVIATDI